MQPEAARRRGDVASLLRQSGAHGIEIVAPGRSGALARERPTAVLGDSGLLRVWYASKPAIGYAEFDIGAVADGSEP
jgi:hypothetical protein